MVQFTGQFAGYTYLGVWHRVSAAEVVWSAAIRHQRELMASPNGMLDVTGMTDADVEIAARAAIHSLIRDGIELSRASESS